MYNKKILSALSVAIILLYSVIEASAVTGPEPKVTNLITDGSGDIRDGVSLIAEAEGVDPEYTGEMTARGKLTDIADGDDSTFWYSQHKYNRPYVVLDLGSPYTITGIRYLPFDGYTDDYTDEDGVLKKPGRYWRNETEIHFSNYEDFSKYKTVYTIDYEGLEDNAALEIELENNINQYRYIRIYRTTPDDYTYPIGIREISVMGYDTFYPQDMLHNTDGTVRDGVNASSPNGGYSGYSDTNSIIDNNYSDEDGIHGSGNSTYISDFGETKPYVQIDLGAVRGIDKIRILPFRGTNADESADWYFRSGLKIYGSNNSGFEGGGKLLYDQGEYSIQNYAPPDKWLETDLSEITLFRYIRIVSSNDVIGITEVQVEGYELFEDIAIANETAPEIYFTTDGTTITAKAVNGGDNILILAAYESNGRMADVQAAVGKATLPINSNYTYKAFLWNSLTELKPEAEPVIYK